jgi:hypothetical protein
MEAKPGESVYERDGKRYVIRWTDRPPGQTEPIEVEVN